MKDSIAVDRRKALQTLGTAIVGGTVLSGTAAAKGNVVSKINSDGHYAWFPLGQERWGRQKHPYDFRDGDSRWMAEPARGGGVRTLARNITTEDTPPVRNAGFDMHMGPLGDLSEITIKSRTVRTTVGDNATLFLGLYLDTSENGEFFHWEKVRGDRESAKPGVAGDDEGLLFIDADGTFTISDSTTFALFTRGFVPATVGELKSGEFKDIDGETHAALYIGITDVDPGTDGVEEAIIEDVSIERS